MKRIRLERSRRVDMLAYAVRLRNPLKWVRNKRLAESAEEL